MSLALFAFGPDFPVVLAAAITGLIALFLLILILLCQPTMLVLGTSERGRLTISRHALHRIVEACCEQVKGVASARALVVRSRGRFNTEVRLKIRPDAKLDAIQGYLTDEITDIYRRNLGLKEVGPIEVKIVGVVDGHADF
ncbi:MAG TPA: hypothetical protein VK717_03080 [Opitutaceae bacterium]|jgi:hypothetical protein|nr:hypothetical protein [Opitutaceae bacterium]